MACYDKHSSDPSIRTCLLSRPLEPLTQLNRCPFRIDAAPTFQKQVAWLWRGWGWGSQHFL